MKILILGAGAVGGYFGARLHQSSADVTFLLREPRAAKVKKEGLVVKSPKGDAVLPVKVVTKGGDGGPYEIVILACKAYDLGSAIDSIAPAVGAGTTIVPMLNGHAQFAVLDKKFGAGKVAGGLARIGGMLGPNGEVMHSSPFAAVSFGERSAAPARESLKALDAACKKAGRGLRSGRQEHCQPQDLPDAARLGLCRLHAGRPREGRRDRGPPRDRRHAGPGSQVRRRRT